MKRHILFGKTIMFIVFIGILDSTAYEMNVFEEAYRADHRGSVFNSNLMSELACAFDQLFDEVIEVDYYSDENIHYYGIVGFKDNLKVEHFVKVNPDDFLNESYTYMDLNNYKNSMEHGSIVQYCFEPVNPDSPNCQPGNGCTYIPYSSSCRVVICGIFELIGGTIPYCNIP